MDWTFGIAAIILMTVGLVGQAIQMRSVRIAQSGSEMGSPNIFLHRSNFKWYAFIGAGVILWYVAERTI